MPDVTGEQQFLLAASRPIRIEYGTHLWDNKYCENIDEARSGKGIVKRSRSLTKNNLLKSFRPLDCGLLQDL